MLDERALRHPKYSDFRIVTCVRRQTQISLAIRLIHPSFRSLTTHSTIRYNDYHFRKQALPPPQLLHYTLKPVTLPTNTSHASPPQLCDSGSNIAIPNSSLTHPHIKYIKVAMPSHLRLQASFEPFEADATYRTSPTLPAAKKQKMSLTRTYAVASTARSKLGREASRADHNLRRLVGHANLLDTLMIDLADAEREQEAWFNSSVSKASPSSENRHIQWFDAIEEDLEDDDSDSDSDVESDDGSIYDEDAEILSIPVRRIRTPPVMIESEALEFSDDEDEDEDAEFDEDDDDEHALTRVPSKHSPPELALDDSDSEDESMPPSPDQPTMELSEKERQQLSTALYGDKSQASSMEDYIMREPQRPLISAY